MLQDTSTSADKRIARLEDQVKGLMETVTLFHHLYHLEALNIPKPDQYVQGGYDISDLQRRFPLLASVAHVAESERSDVSIADLFDPEQAVQSDLGASTVDSAGPNQAAQSNTNNTVTAIDVSSLSPYTYSPLNEASSEIRLLALDTTGSPGDPISCRLITASLDDAREYPDKYGTLPIERFTPLSYCWGTANFTETIIMDGQLFLITPSLYTALQYFRKVIRPFNNRYGEQQKNSETYWWIDAICINQKDIAERNSQVGLMSRLYRAAQTVHIWLGEESDDSTQAMKLIRELAYLPTSPEDIESWQYIPKKAGQTHRPDGPGRRKVKLPTHDAIVLSDEQKLGNYTALIRFYQRAWFSRVWIRQEIALPQDVTFHCGTEACNWRDVMRTADILTYLADEYHLPALQVDELERNDSGVSCFRAALGLYELREEMRLQRDTYGELKVLALKWRDCQATDPRDKVFAMLPLINPDEIDVQADYAKDKQEVYQNTALTLLEHSLDYLSGCQNPTRSNGMPSWVPDLQEPAKPLPTETDYGHQKDLENTWGNPSDDIPDFEYVPDEARLDIQGVIFDEVKVIDEDDYVEAGSSNEQIRMISRQWRALYETLRDSLFKTWEQEGNSEGRDECLGMFDIPFGEESWQWKVLRNSGADQYRAGGDRDDVRFKRWDTDTVDHDPTLKKVKALLPSSNLPFSDILGKDEEYFAEFRPLAIGRRFFFTIRGAIGLVPTEAELGDAICFLDGCACPFVIRKAGSDTWVIVGQACECGNLCEYNCTQCLDMLTLGTDYFGRIVLSQARKKLQKTVIRVV